MLVVVGYTQASIVKAVVTSSSLASGISTKSLIPSKSKELFVATTTGVLTLLQPLLFTACA